MRTFRRVVVVLALAVAGNGVAASSAHADIPELGQCKADAELRVGATGPSVYGGRAGTPGSTSSEI